MYLVFNFCLICWYVCFEVLKYLVWGMFVKIEEKKILKFVIIYFKCCLSCVVFVVGVIYSFEVFDKFISFVFM